MNEFSADLITLLDEDGKEQNFEILDVIVENDTEYYALLPVYENSEDILNDSGEYYILESVEENGEEQLVEVLDEELLSRLNQIFEDRFNEAFYED